jgi:DNA-binding NtrC family response regulator
MEEAAMEFILRHHWKNNFLELHSAVSQMVLLAKKPLISLEDVKAVIQARQGKRETDLIGLDGTLDDIVLRVIRRVLEEEKGNCSRTAARLGIGRSTLWRKLEGSHQANS